MESTQPKHKEVPEKGLTCIHARIHCAATQGGENQTSEEIMVNSFIEALAEVTMTVAHRRLAKVQRVK